MSKLLWFAILSSLVILLACSGETPTSTPTAPPTAAPSEAPVATPTPTAIVAPTSASAPQTRPRQPRRLPNGGARPHRHSRANADT